MKKPFTPSDKQKAVLLYGQRLRGLGNVGELCKHLEALGFREEALMVRGATMLLKNAASQEYKERRLELDPEWKDPVELFREQSRKEQEEWLNQR